MPIFCPEPQILCAALLFSVLTATLGYVNLSISMAMIFAVVCVMGCMTKDVMELCEDLMEEEDVKRR